MQTIQMLRQLTQVDGVAGGEDRALAVAQEICENLGECSRTIQKSLVCQVMPPQEGRPHLLLDAHIDEIGLTVTHIEDNGFLRVGQAGGVDRRLLMASQVVVHTAQGDLPGVVGSVPPHIQSGEKKNPTVDEIWIDVGMDGQQAKEKIDLGSKISFVGPFTEMAGGLVSSKAFDDRCCCVAIIKAAEMIKNDWKENHLEPIGLTVLLSAQEETGGLGARTAAFALHPTQAIVVDPSVGKGPAIGMGAILSRKMSKELIAAAEEEKIPYQLEVMSGGHTGTNADSIVVAQDGVESCCVSIPLRYMHTPIETISVDDVDKTAQLIAAYAKRIVK